MLSLHILQCVSNRLTSLEKISDILIPSLAIIIPSLAIFVPRLAIFIPRLGMSKFNRLLVSIQRTSSNNSIDFKKQLNGLQETIQRASGVNPIDFWQQSYI